MNEQIYSFFKKNHRFLDFENEEIEYLTSKCNIENFEANSTIISEGMLGDKIYLVYSGAIGISKKIGSQSVFFITTLGVGELFGEMSVLTNYPRSATAFASDEATLIALNKHSYESVKKERPEIYSKLNQVLTKVLAERLYKMEERITKILSASLSENIIN